MLPTTIDMITLRRNEVRVRKQKAHAERQEHEAVKCMLAKAEVQMIQGVDVFECHSCMLMDRQPFMRPNEMPLQQRKLVSRSHFLACGSEVTLDSKCCCVGGSRTRE